MYYLDFWFPKVLDGMNVRVGRYISIPDIEAQFATNKLNKNWSIQTELSSGNDVAPSVWMHRLMTIPRRSRDRVGILS